MQQLTKFYIYIDNNYKVCYNKNMGLKNPCTKGHLLSR